MAASVHPSKHVQFVRKKFSTKPAPIGQLEMFDAMMHSPHMAHQSTARANKQRAYSVQARSTLHWGFLYPAASV